MSEKNNNNKNNKNNNKKKNPARICGNIWCAQRAVSAALRVFPLKVARIKLRVIYCGQIKPYCRGRLVN